MRWHSGALIYATGGELKLWDCETTREPVVFEGHKGMVRVVAFSPDGGRLATGSVESLRGEQFGPDGSPVPEKHSIPASSRSRDLEQWGAVKIWNANTGRLDATVAKFGTQMVSLDFSPDGNLLAACSTGAPVTLFDASTGRKVAEFESTTDYQADGGYELAFVSSGVLAMATLQKETIRLLDVSTGRIVKSLRGHLGFLRGIAPGPGGHTLLSGSLDGTVREWNLDSHDGPRLVDVRPDRLTSVAYSPDGRWLATAGGPGPVALADLRNGDKKFKLEANGLPVTGLHFSTDGNSLACGTEWFTFPTGVIVWDLATRRPRFSLAPDTRMGTALSRSGGLVAFAPDGQTLACAGGSGGRSVRILDGASGELRYEWEGRWGPVRSLTFSRNGRLLAAGYQDHVVALRYSSSGELVHLLDCTQGTVTGMSFSPDSHLLAIANGERNVLVWSVADGRLVRQLTGHTRTVNGTAFSPDGRRLASVGLEVKLWDMASFQELLSLPAPGQAGWCLSWSPDGHSLAVAGGDSRVGGEAWVWSIETRADPVAR